MIRICHLITDLGVGGAERMLANLTSRMDRGRFANEIVSMTGPGGAMADEIARNGIPLTTLGMQRRRPTVSGYMRLVRHLKRERPDILQTWLYHADLLGALVSPWRPSARLIWNVRCTDISEAPGETRLRWILRALAALSRRPDAVIVNTRLGQSFHQQIGYRPRRWIGIPNGVDGGRFQPSPAARAELRAALRIAPEALVIGMVARFHPMKDHATFLRAAALFARDNPSVRFILCGRDCERANPKLAELVAESGVADRISLLGVHADIERVYPALDLVTLSSAYGEGFPNALIEAMACGVPCVATTVCDGGDIIGDAGRVVAPRDPAAMAQAWREVLREDRSAMATRARNRALEHFSLDRVALQYEMFYEDVMGHAAQHSSFAGADLGRKSV